MFLVDRLCNEHKFFLEKNCFDYKQFKKSDPIAKNQRDYAHGSIRRALEYFLLNNGFKTEDDLIFIERMRSTFKKLYNWRRQGDYQEIVISKKNLKKAIVRAEMFISELKKYSEG